MTNSHLKLYCGPEETSTYATPEDNVTVSVGEVLPLIADAVKGRESAKLFFAFNCAVVWLAAIALFGYPAIILPALALVPVIFAGLFATTRM